MDGWFTCQPWLKNFKVNFEKVNKKILLKLNEVNMTQQGVEAYHLKNNQSSHTHTFKPKKIFFFFFKYFKNISEYH